MSGPELVEKQAPPGPRTPKAGVLLPQYDYYYYYYYHSYYYWYDCYYQKPQTLKPLNPKNPNPKTLKPEPSICVECARK